MKYIVCKSFNKKCMSGKMTLLKGSTCTVKQKIIWYNDLPICAINSQDARDYFALNDDNAGYERFALTHDIIEKMNVHRVNYINAVNEALSEAGEITDEEKQQLISQIENVAETKLTMIKAHNVFKKYINEYGIWTYEFYNADIENLRDLQSKL